MPFNNPKAQNQFEQFLLGGSRKGRTTPNSSNPSSPPSSPFSKQRNKNAKATSSLPPFMSNTDTDSSPVALSHPTQSSSHFDQNKLARDERKATVSLNPMTSVSNFEQQQQQQQQNNNNLLLYSPSSSVASAAAPSQRRNSQNMFSTQQARTPPPPAASPVAKTFSALLMKQQQQQQQNQGTRATTPSLLAAPTSKPRQSFNQKIEEARRLASPARIDRQLGVEINFDPLKKKSNFNDDAENDDNKQGQDAEKKESSHIQNKQILPGKGNQNEKLNTKQEERSRVIEEIKLNARSPSPIKERSEAASEVAWCRFAYNQLEQQERDVLSTYRSKQQKIQEKKKQRQLSAAKSRATRNEQSSRSSSAAGSFRMNKMSARERLLFQHNERIGKNEDDEAEDEEEEFEEEEEGEEDHQDGTPLNNSKTALNSLAGSVLLNMSSSNNANNNNSISNNTPKPSLSKVYNLPKKRKTSKNKKKQQNKNNNDDDEELDDSIHDDDDYLSPEELSKPGLVRKSLAPTLAKFAQQIQQAGKDKFINGYQNEFKDWDIEEMLAAAEEKHGEDFLEKAVALAATTQNNNNSNLSGVTFDLVGNNITSSAATVCGSTAAVGSPSISSFGNRRGVTAATKFLPKSTRDLLSKKRQEQQQQQQQQSSLSIQEMKEALRTSFEQAFSPLRVKLHDIFDGQDLSSKAIGSLRTFDQRVMFLKKRMQIQEASKRKASVRYIRDITESLRQDEGLFKSFSEDVRKEQMQRAREHRAAQDLLETQRRMFQDRTTQQRAEDFLKVEQIRRQKAEASRIEQEESFFAYCSNALAMRRGASYSRQYAWMPIIVFVISLIRFDKKLRRARASLAEQRVMESAQRDFSNVFVPTRVTGFLKLAQGYKDAAKKSAVDGAMMGGGGRGGGSAGGKQLSKADKLIVQEIRKKREHYAELKKEELEHPQYMFDALFARLRELQFPIFLKRAFMRQRHRSADRLVVFLRTLFQQTVIRIRCKTYLKYMRACAAAFLQAVRNRRTRRNFVWVLQFKQAVQERKFYDLLTCVESDHVLKRRERIRQKCAYEHKKALESVALMREKMLQRKVEAIVGSAIPESEKRKRRRRKNNNNNDNNFDDDDFDDDDNYSDEDDTNQKNTKQQQQQQPTSPLMSCPMSPQSWMNTSSANNNNASPLTRPGTAISSSAGTHLSSSLVMNIKSPNASPIRLGSGGGGGKRQHQPLSPSMINQQQQNTFYRGENGSSASPADSPRGGGVGGGRQNMTMTTMTNNSSFAASATSPQSQQATLEFINNQHQQLLLQQQQNIDITHLAQSNPHAAVAAAQTDHDVCRLLCAPVMIEHPYGKFGSAPRESALVARATMDFFRCSEIKWSPSETAMTAILEYVQKVEDRYVYDQYVEWISLNRQHQERADFLESVLSHLREDSATKPDLEKQYQALLERKPKPPRQPYVLPASEMRIIVFAAYTLTAQEKRVSAKSSATKNENQQQHQKQNGDGGGGSDHAWKVLPDGKPNPIYLEANLKSHMLKALSMFKELHGNVRPFLLAAHVTTSE